MERFLGRIAPYDPHPDEAVVSLEMRVGRARGSFRLTARATRALTEMLVGYLDPDDCGSCANCGKPLNRDLYCVGCGHLDGIFGQALAHHAADVLRRQAAESRAHRHRA